MSKILSATRKLEIALHTNSMVATQFALFQNPNNRGSAFTWERFIDMMTRNAEIGSKLNLVLATPKESDYAVQIARTEATRLVKLLQE